MSSRKVQRRLRSKLAVVALVALAGVVALTIPNLAGAITSPLISSPSDNALLGAGSRTIAFSMPSDDLSETDYTLLRGAPSSGACNSTALAAASPAGGAGGTEPASPPTAPGPLSDNDSILDGVYCYWVEADDSIGLETADSPGVKVTIDTTAPTVPGTPALTGSSPRSAAPVLTFSPSSDLHGPITYQLYRDGNPTGDTSTTTTITDTHIASNGADDGSHVYTVRAVDALSNASAQSSGSSGVVTDNTAPAPAPGSLTLSDSVSPRNTAPSFTFTGSTDTHGVTYVLLRDGSPTGDTSSTTTITDTSLATNGTDDGAYSYSVVAKDSVGNQSAASNAVPVTIDYTKPTAPTSVASDGGGPRNTAPAFTFASSSDLNGVVGYQLYRDGVATGDTSASSPISDTHLSTTGSDDGTHSYTVRAVDGAGNVSVASGSASVTIDYTKPTLPTSVALSGGVSPRKAAPTITFSASSDAHGPIVYHLYRDGSATGDTSTTTSITDTHVALDGSQDGAHTYTVSAVDTVGNASAQSSSSVSVTIDDTAPTVPTSVAISDGNALRNTAPTFTYSASTEANGTVTYHLFRDGVATTDTSTTLSITDTHLAGNGADDGAHVYTVTASDPLGNTSNASSGVSVTTDFTKPTVPGAPALVGASPRSTRPSFTFTTSTDTNGPITYQLYRDGSATGDTSSTGSIADTTLLLNGTADGTHTYAVRAVDSATNASVLSSTASVYLDTTPPTAPTGFTLIGPATRSSAPAFFFTPSTDAAPGTITYRLYRKFVATGVTTFTGITSTSPSISDTVITLLGADDGSYAYTVRAVDASGNEGAASAEVAVVIDGGPPTVPGNLRTTAALTRNAPTLSWDASTGTPSGYRVVRNGQVIGTVSAPTTTFIDSLPLDGSMDGTYTYTVIAVDSVPNASAPSSPLQITLDTQRPSPSSSLVIDKSPTSAKPVLVWPGSASGDVAGYNVYRGGSKVNGSLVSGTSFTDTGLDADGTYVYTVRAVDKAGNESSDSMGASVLYDTTAPGTPGASAVAAASGGMATVSWSAASDAGSGVASYQVRRSSANGAGPAALAAGTPVCGAVPASALGCADSGLTPGASYRYSVFAIDAVGNVSPAGQTSTISIPTNADKTPPKAPTALKAVVANGQIDLTWKNPKSDLATVWVVWNAKRAPKSSSDGNSVYHGTASKLTVKLPKLAAGKELRFAVFAADKAGNVSVAARATIIMPRPSAVSLAPNGKLSGSPDLTWNAVTGATYYNVQVFEGTQASKRVAIGWPAVTKYTLPGVKMKKGKVYTWYVWPGIGAKSAAKYGKLIGKVTFTYSG